MLRILLTIGMGDLCLPRRPVIRPTAVAGRLVAVLAIGDRDAGGQSVALVADALPGPGIYFVRLDSRFGAGSRRFVFIGTGR